MIVGAGDGFVPAILRQALSNVGDGRVHTLDFDVKLRPDYVGDIRDIKAAVGDQTFDCILCSQVLEHIEYVDVERVLSSFAALARRVVISVPYRHRKLLGIRVKLPKKREWGVNILLPKRFRGYELDGFGEHYWELGRGVGCCKPSLFEALLKKYFVVERKYRVPENPYHFFYILETMNVR